MLITNVCKGCSGETTHQLYKLNGSTYVLCIKCGTRTEVTVVLQPKGES